VRTDNRFRLPRGPVATRLLGSPTVRQAVRRVLPPVLRPVAKERLLRSAAKPPMDPEARRMLEELYEPDSRQLALLIGPLPWWPRRSP
jgi:hypothetical protein